MTRNRSQLGAFTPLAGAAALVLAVLALGAITIGRMAAVKSDSQRAADAAALAAAQLIRDNGMPFDATLRDRAEIVGRGNSSQPIDFTWAMVEDGDSVDIEVTATINMTAPTLIVAGGATEIQSRAKASVTQTRFDDADRRLPKLVMVLDYSGSMGMGMPGAGGASAMQVLKQSVNSLLDADLRIDYGVVLYSSGIISTVPVAEGTPAHINNIRAVVNGHGAGGMTCTSCGINRAREMLLAGPDTGRYVLVVSDGLPNNGGGQAGSRSAASSVWGIDGSIFTLHVDWSSGGSPGPLRNFMISISGAYTAHPDPNYYFFADSASTLTDTFKIIVSSIVCSVGPLDPPPDDPSTMNVFLDVGGAERLVPVIPPGTALADFPTEERYRYDVPTQTVRLTELACDAVIDDGAEIVVRFDRPDLIE